MEEGVRSAADHFCVLTNNSDASGDKQSHPCDFVMTRTHGCSMDHVELVELVAHGSWLPVVGG